MTWWRVQWEHLRGLNVMSGTKSSKRKESNWTGITSWILVPLMQTKGNHDDTSSTELRKTPRWLRKKSVKAELCCVCVRLHLFQQSVIIEASERSKYNYTQSTNIWKKNQHCDVGRDRLLAWLINGSDNQYFFNYCIIFWMVVVLIANKINTF